MSRLSRPPGTEPGPECICAAELKEMPLPAELCSPELIAINGGDTVLIHVETGDTRCYPEAASAADRSITAEIYHP